MAMSGTGEPDNIFLVGSKELKSLKAYQFGTPKYLLS